MVGEERVYHLVKPSVNYVCQLKFPSGNYPPCVGDSRDLLVHWCHGTPGVIYMLIQAFKVQISPCQLLIYLCPLGLYVNYHF